MSFLIKVLSAPLAYMLAKSLFKDGFLSILQRLINIIFAN